MKSLLMDKYGRQLTYLRLSVTDRCNFRCYYCMPEEGVDFAARKDLLSFSELLTISRWFCEMGVNKIRITGGEPFVRKGIMPFLEKLSQIEGLDQITITSNGTLNQNQIRQLKNSGILKINISLDSLDRERFFLMTRRDKFDEVYECVIQLLEEGFDVKLNCVIDDNKNIADIIPFIELTKKYPLAVRFLEEMPFNGQATFEIPKWNHKAIYQHIEANYSAILKLQDEKSSTSVNYQIPGYLGTFGIIPSFSRTFCGTCNRIRLSATGELRTCLYGPPTANIRDIYRSESGKEAVIKSILDAVAAREKDGFAAEESLKKSPKKSMSFLGG